jgi:SAM-dependent methyltransferase
MNIDRFARWYRWFEYAAFGRALERSRSAYFDRLAGARRILVLGEGDGRALAELLAAAPLAEIHVYELSPRMIELARRRAGNSPRATFHQGDALGAEWPDRAYDAATALYFLDCFEDRAVAELARRIDRALVPGGLWLVSDFAIPGSGWRKAHAVACIWTMYRFFRLATRLKTQQLPHIHAILGGAGFALREERTQRAGLIWSSLWQKTT